MDWKKLLGPITASVDEEIRRRNAYLVTENRILRQQITSRVQLTDADRRILAELGQQLGGKNPPRDRDSCQGRYSPRLAPQVRQSDG